MVEVTGSGALLKVIPPSADLGDSNARKALHLIRKIGRRLSREDVHNFLLKTIDEGMDSSVRMIQANRFEIFFHESAKKGTKCIDTLLKKFDFDPLSTREAIITYAVSQTKKDERLGNKEYKFGNFSLIVTYGSVDAQAPHVDLLHPNFQFGMMLTNGPGTVGYDTTHKVRSVQDLKVAWERADEIDRNFGHKTDPIPENLLLAMHESKDVQTLVRGFGDVLVPDEELRIAAKSAPNLPAGTLMSLPGCVVHAGPKADHFRAVMFFSAWPVCQDNTKVAEYDPDTQYSSVFLCGRLVQLLWRQAGVEYRERKYLLEKLYRYIRQGGNTPKAERVQREFSLHFSWDALTAFIATMEQDLSPSRDKDMEKIKETAENENLTFFNVQGSDDGMLAGDFVLISVPNLSTVWEGERFEIKLYERPSDGKVLVYYPKDNSPIGYSWEGIDSGEHYRLERLPDSDIEEGEEGWFDGSNGTLLDGDGCAIECSIGLPKMFDSENLVNALEVLGAKRKNLSAPPGAKRARLG